MNLLHPTRHLLRAKDLVDGRYREALDVPTLARAAGLSAAHFSRELVPGPPVFDAETAEQIRSVLAKGATGGLFFDTDDIQGSYEALKARGVEFQQEPTEQPYGVDAGFRDVSGNHFRLVQQS